MRERGERVRGELPCGGSAFSRVVFLMRCDRRE